MKRHVVLGAWGLLVVGLLVTGCGGPPGDSPNTPLPTVPGHTATTNPSAAESSASGSTGSTSAGVAVEELRDGTWQVGDAGEVEFLVKNGSLALTEVRPADGWNQWISDEKPDEIEVHFTRDNMHWKFEIELERNRMQITKEVKITQGEGGTHQVGSAAEVTLDTDGTTLSLSDVRVSDGWTIVKQEESADDIELDFRNDGINGSAEFEAELERGGVDLEISQRIAGPTPG